MPDMSGLWVRVATFEIHDILMGNVAVQERHRETCMKVMPSERANQATMAMTNEEGNVTRQSMELESGEGTCRIALHELVEGDMMFLNYFEHPMVKIGDMSN